MLSPVNSILRNSKKLNVLSMAGHERYETNLANTGHNFYLFNLDNIKKWVPAYAPLPPNFVLLKKGTLPNIVFDLAIAHSKFGHFQHLKQITQQLNIPLIYVEHTLPQPNWSQEYIDQISSMRGDHNVFITDFNKEGWRWQENNDTSVIYHAIDTELFKPDGEKQNYILSVNNDFINRDIFLNYRLFQAVTQGLPVKPVGDTEGLSKAANSTEELVKEYQTASIYLNTAHVSPVPMALLEGMACGLAPVSVNACAISHFIEHGVSGYLTNDPNEMRQYLVELLQQPKKAKEMGEAARQSIIEKCNLDRFTQEWNEVLENVYSNRY